MGETPLALDATPYRRAAFDREEKLYFLKAALLVAVVYFFRREISSLAGIFVLFVPLFFFSYVWFKSIHTGDRIIDILREHITLMPIPYAERGKKIFIPWATIALVLVNIAVFYTMRLLSLQGQKIVLDKFMFIPHDMGGVNLMLSPLASMFLHANAGHLWGNMAFLWAYSPAVEERLGVKKFVLLYLLTGLMGSLTELVIGRLFFHETMHGFGASGAVSGIMGIFMVRCYFKKLVIPLPVFGLISAKLKVNSLLPLGVFFLLDLESGVRELAGSHSGIGYWDHLGSMAGGVLLAILFRLHWKAAEEKYTEAGLAAMDDPYFRRESADSLQSALQLNPDNEAALLGLAREYALTRKPEGRDLFQRAIRLKLRSSPDDALEIYKEYFSAYNLMLEPDLQYRLAGIFYHQGDHEPAARSLEMIILEPSSSDATRQRAFYQLIVLLAENNMLEAAHYRLEQFKEQFPQAELVQAAEDKFVEMLRS
jgi:membrane associated rhomboid family serine protease